MYEGYEKIGAGSFGDVKVTGATCRKVCLCGKNIYYIFLYPDLIFCRFLLKEAIAHPPEFLTGYELEKFTELAVEKRRIEFLFGRIAVKLLLLKVLKVADEFVNYEIINDEAGRPVGYLRFNDQEKIRLNHCISISHRGGSACAAVSIDSSSIGIDVELMELLDSAMYDDYFTEEEILTTSGLSVSTPFTLSLLWSIKESILKAAGKGLMVSARMVEIKRVDLATRTVEASGAGELNGDNFIARYILHPPYIISIATKI